MAYSTNININIITKVYKRYKDDIDLVIENASDDDKIQRLRK